MPATPVPPPDAHLAFPARPRFLPVRPGPLGDIPAAAGARHANASEFYLLQHRPFVRREGSPRPDFSIAPYPRESPPGMFSQTRSSAQPSDTFMRGAPFDSNPAVTPPAPKVWILDCKSCGTFLTNRGMKVRSKTFGSRLRRESLALTLDIDPLKAVLLLRPSVSLFSTDALPINCSAYSSNPDSSRAHSSSFFSSNFSRGQSPARTCNCLTQTLCCHGCGSAIGYMIVNPVRLPHLVS